MDCRVKPGNDGRDSIVKELAKYFRPSLRANGSRECAPDDGLREAIHFTAQKEEWIASSLSLLAMTVDTTLGPATAIRPSPAKTLRPEGVGNAGCPLHPRPRVQKVVSTR